MSTPKADRVTSEREIKYLSSPAEVSMADRWFEIASIEHFWVQRRFEVLRRLAEGLIISAKDMAEIGCGNGLLQRQIEDGYDMEVAGFDLNEFALKQNVSRRSAVCCYDIFCANPTLQSKFDLIFLFDVLEHISDEDGFLAALRFHLAGNGKLILNVPAGQWAYSKYDQAAGHVRRYSIGMLRETAARSGLRVQKWSYWGLPLVPTLAVRRLWLKSKKDKAGIISSGFDPRSKAINRLLRLVSQCELVPQKVLGTSLMAILERTEK
jgi:cyclopropane fatty-acyl-phospholipid synthase-like methyltransferase